MIKFTLLATLASLAFFGCGGASSDGDESPVANEPSIVAKNAAPLSSNSKESLMTAMGVAGIADGSKPQEELNKRSDYLAAITSGWNSVDFRPVFNRSTTPQRPLLMANTGCWVSRVVWPGSELKDAGWVAVAENKVDLSGSIIRIFDNSDGNGWVEEADEVEELTFSGAIVSALWADGDDLLRVGLSTGSQNWKVHSIIDSDSDDIPDSSVLSISSSDPLVTALPYTMLGIVDFGDIDRTLGTIFASQTFHRSSSKMVFFTTTNFTDLDRDGVFEAVNAGIYSDPAVGAANNASPELAVEPVANDTKVWARFWRRDHVGTTAYTSYSAELLIDGVSIETKALDANGFVRFDLANPLVSGQEIKVRHVENGMTTEPVSVLASPAKAADAAWAQGNIVTSTTATLRIEGERLSTSLIYSLAGAYCEGLLSGPKFVDIQIPDDLYKQNKGRTKTLYIYDAARENIIDKIRVRFPRE